MRFFFKIFVFETGVLFVSRNFAKGRVDNGSGIKGLVIITREQVSVAFVLCNELLGSKVSGTLSYMWRVTSILSDSQVFTRESRQVVRIASADFNTNTIFIYFDKYNIFYFNKFNIFSE